jgi:hypothetical protein
LPGYRWKVREDKDGDIEIKLINPSGVSCQGTEFVIARSKTAKELESRVKERMKMMLSNEHNSYALKATKQSIIDKYNDTHIELEP